MAGAARPSSSSAPSELRARSATPPKCWTALEIPTASTATAANATKASFSQRGTTQVRFSSIGMPE